MFSEATHTLVVALSMFVAADGDLEKSVVGAVMYGRDKDSYASVVGALAGAFSGAKSIRNDWVETVLTANTDPDIAGLAGQLSQIITDDIRERLTNLDDLNSLI